MWGRRYELCDGVLPRTSKYKSPFLWIEMMVILIALLEGFKSLLAVLPTSRPKRPGLVKPGTRADGS